MLVFKTALVGSVLLSSSFLAACSGSSHTENSSGSTGAGGASSSSSSSSSSSGFVPAAYGAVPEVVNGGGPVLTAPKLQIIAYASDPMMPGVDAMAAEFSAMASWADQTAEYGVGPLTVLPTISLTEPLPTLDDNSPNPNSTPPAPSPFQANLAAQLTGAEAAWGVADPSTIYMFLLPAGADFTGGGSCCTDFLGYHDDAAVGAITVPYAILCDCGTVPGIPLTALQWVTTTVSHEAVEAATDPFFETAPAWYQSDNPHAIWTIATGGEVADMCEFNSDSNYIPPGSTYMVQRSWSNAAATAGLNPCVPHPVETYFNSYPVFTESVTLNYFGAWTTKGVTIPLNKSGTVDIILSSDAETAPWTVEAFDLNAYITNDPKQANTTVSLDKSTGVNGDTLHLTITVNSSNPMWGGEGFVLQSTLGEQQNLSMGAIVN